MKATLSLELFGDNLRQQLKLYSSAIDDAFGDNTGSVTIGNVPPSSWVAEITGFHVKYKYERKFLRYKKDYTKSNSKGSRGIFVWYILESGRYYEVKAKTSWRNEERYFCKVNSQGDVIKVDKNEVDAWLNNRLE